MESPTVRLSTENQVYGSENTDSNQNTNANLLEQPQICADSEIKKDSVPKEKNFTLEEPFLSAAWSSNPTNENWQVKLLLHNARPDNLQERIGFIGVSTLEINKEGVNVSKVVKVNSTHRADEFDNRTFQKLLNKGSLFTKLELCGSFFNNVYICPSTCISSESMVHLIQFPHLKHLILKQKFNIPLKGTDTSTRDQYYQIHQRFFDDTKDRAAKNIWYVIKSFNCPKLQKLEIQDCVEWEQPEDNVFQEERFLYWGQPLIDFLTRHSSTLKILNVSPIPVSQNLETIKISKDELPILEELRICPKLSLKFRDTKPDKNPEAWFQDGIEIQLKSWRKILQSQKDLKTIGWICDSLNPFPITKNDFLRVCADNPHTEFLMLVLHGDQVLRNKLGVEEKFPLMNLKDFQIDTAEIHGLTSLKVLSIGCCSDDPQKRNFCLFNLHLLPSSLETLNLSGIRVPASELEQLGRLKNLKTLTIFDEDIIPYALRDENNGNIEGVTDTVLKMLINMRNLNQLVIMGFPIPKKDSEEVKLGTVRKENGGLCSFFGYICGSSSSSNPNEDEEISNKESKMDQYTTSLQDLLRSLMDAGEVRDIKMGLHTKDQETLLSIGKSEEFPLTNYIK